MIFVLLMEIVQKFPARNLLEGHQQPHTSKMLHYIQNLNINAILNFLIPPITIQIANVDFQAVLLMKMAIVCANTFLAIRLIIINTIVSVPGFLMGCQSFNSALNAAGYILLLVTWVIFVEYLILLSRTAVHK